MRLRWLILLAIIVTVGIPALAQDTTVTMTPEPDPSAQRLHIVDDDSLLDISHRYNVCLSDILQANPTVDENASINQALRSGMEIFVPVNQLACYSGYVTSGNENI